MNVLVSRWMRKIFTTNVNVHFFSRFTNTLSLIWETIEIPENLLGNLLKDERNRETDVLLLFRAFLK